MDWLTLCSIASDLVNSNGSLFGHAAILEGTTDVQYLFDPLGFFVISQALRDISGYQIDSGLVADYPPFANVIVMYVDVSCECAFGLIRLAGYSRETAFRRLTSFLQKLCHCSLLHDFTLTLPLAGTSRPISFGAIRPLSSIPATTLCICLVERLIPLISIMLQQHVK
jgi:hypothetical protein